VETAAAAPLALWSRNCPLRFQGIGRRGVGPTIADVDVAGSALRRANAGGNEVRCAGNETTAADRNRRSEYFF
jgi:hypothetical protein